MGNSSSKDKPSSRPASVRHPSGHPSAPAQASHAQQPSAERVITQIYAGRAPRGSRPDLTFLSLNRDRDRERESGDGAPERPRETKQERDARRAEKERQARLKERERSMREEGVDGGYVVTLGVYTGPEDFNKGIVRQLQVGQGAGSGCQLY